MISNNKAIAITIVAAMKVGAVRMKNTQMSSNTKRKVDRVDSFDSLEAYASDEKPSANSQMIDDIVDLRVDLDREIPLEHNRHGGNGMKEWEHRPNNEDYKLSGSFGMTDKIQKWKTELHGKSWVELQEIKEGCEQMIRQRISKGVDRLLKGENHTIHGPEYEYGLDRHGREFIKIIGLQDQLAYLRQEQDPDFFAQDLNPPGHLRYLRDFYGTEKKKWVEEELQKRKDEQHRKQLIFELGEHFDNDYLKEKSLEDLRQLQKELKRKAERKKAAEKHVKTYEQFFDERVWHGYFEVAEKLFEDMKEDQCFSGKSQNYWSKKWDSLLRGKTRFTNSILTRINEQIKNAKTMEDFDIKGLFDEVSDNKDSLKRTFGCVDKELVRQVVEEEDDKEWKELTNSGSQFFKFLNHGLEAKREAVALWRMRKAERSVGWFGPKVPELTKSDCKEAKYVSAIVINEAYKKKFDKQ